MRTVLRSDGLNAVGAGFFSILAAVLLVFFSAGMNPCHGSSSDTSGTQLPEVGTVTASAGNLRSRPALDASIIDKVQRGDNVFFLKGKADWFVVKLQDGRVGWAHESLFLENNRRPDSIQSFLEKDAAETDTRATLAVDIGRIREAPSTDAAIKFKLIKGETVSVVETENDWHLIETEDGSLGWAYKTLFTEKAGPPEPINTVLEKEKTAIHDRAELRVDIGRVREAPSADAEIKFKLIKGDVVSIVEKKEGWFLIKAEDGSMGWAHQSLFDEPVPAEFSSAPAPAETVETRGQAEAPEVSTPYDIKEIEFIMTPEREEIVSFLLSGYYPPNTFSVTKDSPKVICDFFNARLNSGIERYQEYNGKFIHQLRIGIHKGSRPKVRVILDLVPDEEYEIRPVFFKEDNLYTLIVAKKNKEF